MVKINLIIINKVNIFTIHESLLEHVINILLTIYQNKTKVLGKSSKFRSWLKGEVSCINCAQAIWTLFLAELVKDLQFNGSTWPNENYLRNTSLFNSFEIWSKVGNFSYQPSAQRESQYLLYNQRKSTYILSYVFDISFRCHN